MTVRFKSQSEYQRSFGVSRSRSLSPQRCGPLAGLRSDHFGICREPGFQRRKRHGPGAAQFGTAPLCPSGPDSDAQRIEASAASRSCSNHRKEPKHSTPPEHRSTSEPKTPPGPRPAAESEPAGNSGPTAEQIAAIKSGKDASVFPVKLHSSPHDSCPVTAVPNGQQPPANKGEQALRWRSGSRGRRSGAHRSEYHRQFDWKKPSTAASPLLTAEQVLYSTSRSVPPFKKNPIPLETEYVRSFQGQVPPTGPRLRKHLEHQRMPLFHMQQTHRRKKEESQKKRRQGLDATQTDNTRSQSPPPPAQRRHRILTEYESSFRSPLYRIPEEGAAAGGDSPQVKELREKAQAYRRRAWGTNFSRDHLNQLQSEHNALWEPTDSATELASLHLSPDLSRGASCLEALDLASRSSYSSKRSSLVGSAEILKPNKSTQNSPETKAQTPPSPATRRTAWGEEEEEHTEDEEGRLPTPRLKMRPVQRTHHDLTTPATGGAIIVGKLNNDDSSPYYQQAGGSPVSMATRMDRATDMSVKQREVGSEKSPTRLKANHGQASKPTRVKQTPLSSVAMSPLHGIQGTMRHPEFQHNGELGLRFRELQCPGGGCCSDEDDRLSVMSWRSAASCSMASSVLERAQKRRDNFWGKR